MVSYFGLQMEQLAKALPHLPYFVFAPAHYEVDMTVHPPVILHEGVGLLSRFPLFNTTYVPLSRQMATDRSDAHNRACVHGSIQLNSQRHLHLFSTHMSLSPVARVRNVNVRQPFILETYHGCRKCLSSYHLTNSIRTTFTCSLAT